MNKLQHIFLSILLAILPAMAFAAQIDETEALEKAQQFYNQQCKSLLRSTSELNFELVYSRKDSSSLLRSADINTPTYFYVFNVGNDHGFVIVSGDDGTKSILAYSDEGSFSADNMPANLKKWLDFYQSEISYAMKRGSIQTVTTTTSNNVTLRSAKTVAPLLGKIKWNQTDPYNILCPYDSKTKERTVTGCIATAMAQIMKYYQWPVTGIGSIKYKPSYRDTITVNFSKTTYDWDQMLDSYTGGSTPRQDTAIATLMFHCGTSAMMDYDIANNGGSSAYDSDAASGLINNFGYDPDIDLLYRNYYTDSEWKTLLKKELDASRPVLYRGSTKDYSGHAFVCDGYDGNEFFHMNWGWGGAANGYYELSTLDPFTSGSGGIASGFYQEQGFIGGIQKPDTITKDVDWKIAVFSQGLSSSKSRLKTSSETTDLSFGFLNTGLNVLKGYLGLGLYQNGTLQQVMDTSFVDGCPYYYGSYEETFNKISLAGIEPGVYNLRLIYCPSGKNISNLLSWSPLKETYTLKNYVDVTISNSETEGLVATITKPITSPILNMAKAIQPPKTIYKGKMANFTIEVSNTGADFYSNVGVLLYSATNPSVKQYISSGGLCIAAGETKTVTFGDNIDCIPGSYYAVAVYDSTNTFSTGDFKRINSVENIPIAVTIKSESSSPNLILTKSLSLSQNNIYKDEEFTISFSVQNTGGYFDSNIYALVCSDTLGVGLDVIGPVTAYIDSTGTQDITMKATLELDSANYAMAVFYELPSGDFIQFSTPFFFHLSEREQEKEPDMIIYPNPVKDILFISSAETIRNAQVTDLFGRLVLSVQNSFAIPVSSLEKGIYFLNIETDKWTKTERFIKE
ncbi:MAG: C10 family peptidase [Bacteroidales bacterium]|nr:C10 family peptidase [Bacteroidales bacterium]